MVAAARPAACIAHTRYARTPCCSAEPPSHGAAADERRGHGTCVDQQTSTLTAHSVSFKVLTLPAPSPAFSLSLSPSLPICPSLLIRTVGCGLAVVQRGRLPGAADRGVRPAAAAADELAVCAAATAAAARAVLSSAVRPPAARVPAMAAATRPVPGSEPRLRRPTAATAVRAVRRAAADAGRGQGAVRWCASAPASLLHGVCRRAAAGPSPAVRGVGCRSPVLTPGPL